MRRVRVNSCEKGTTDPLLAGRAVARLAVGASSTPATRAEVERLAELPKVSAPKVGRVAMSAESAMTIFRAVAPPLAIACLLC